MGFGKYFVQFVYDFHGFEKVDEESTEAFSNLVTLSKELELDLQEDDIIDLLAVQYEVLTNEDLMELEAQRNDEERQEKEEVTEELEGFTMQQMARRVHAKSLQSCLTLCNLWTVATSLLCPWDFPGKNTGVGCHALFQGIFLTQGSSLHLQSLLH